MENSAGDDDDDHDEHEDPCEEERDKEVVACTAEIPTCEIPANTVDGEGSFSFFFYYFRFFVVFYMYFRFQHVYYRDKEFFCQNSQL